MPQGTGSDLRGLLATDASSPRHPAVNASGVALVQLVPRGERGSGEGGGRGERKREGRRGMEGKEERRGKEREGERERELKEGRGEGG